ELARLRPDPRYLTAFYLTMSAGGAGGGLLVALVAPTILPDYWEFHLCLAAGMLIAIVTFYHDRGWLSANDRPPVFWTGLAILLISVVGVVFAEELTKHTKSLKVVRNFYGVLRAE